MQALYKACFSNLSIAPPNYFSGKNMAGQQVKSLGLLLNIQRDFIPREMGQELVVREASFFSLSL